MYTNLEIIIIFSMFFISVFTLKVLFNKSNYNSNKIILFIDSLITLILLIWFILVSNYIWFRNIESRVSDVWFQILILIFTWIGLPYIYTILKKKIICKFWGKPTSYYWIIEFAILFFSLILTLILLSII